MVWVTCDMLLSSVYRNEYYIEYSLHPGEGDRTTFLLFEPCSFSEFVSLVVRYLDLLIVVYGCRGGVPVGACYDVAHAWYCLMNIL